GGGGVGGAGWGGGGPRGGPGGERGSAIRGPPAVVAVLGLGEAGAAIGHDLVASGVTVRGFDPLTGGPDGIIATGSDAEACRGADLVLSLTTAHEAGAALADATPGLAPGAPYADLETTPARPKSRPR